MTHEEKAKLDDLIKSALEGNPLQRLSFDQIHNESIWIDADFLPIMKAIDVSHWRIKPKAPTREEITSQWVKDNDVKVGDMVRVTSVLPNGDQKLLNLLGEVKLIRETDIRILVSGVYSLCDIETLQKVASKIIPFTFEDREEFRGKWVRHKNFGFGEFFITYASSEKIQVGSDFYTYDEALEILEFIDGKPFGKEIWE
jgi:hypothetical protein